MAEAVSWRDGLLWTRDVLVQWRRWTRRNWKTTLLLSALAFVVGWIWNTYIMAVDLGGSVVADPASDTTATAEGHIGNALYWLLLFSLVGGLITYAWSRGWTAFWSDLAALPRRFGRATTASPAAAFAMLLWGASVSLIISTLISSAVSLALGLVLLALSAAPIGIVLNFALIRLWRGLSGLITPNADARIGASVGPFMVMVGEALGLFLDWMIGNWLVGLLLGVGAAVASVLLVRATPTPRAAAFLLLAGAVVLLQVLRARGAYADDGGWNECKNAQGEYCSGLGIRGIFVWITSPGAGKVIGHGAVGGFAAAIGALLGVGVGGAAAGLAAAAAPASPAQGGPPGQRPAPGAPPPHGPAPRGHVYGSSAAGGAPSPAPAPPGGPAGVPSQGGPMQGGPMQGGFSEAGYSQAGMQAPQAVPPQQAPPQQAPPQQAPVQPGSGDDGPSGGRGGSFPPIEDLLPEQPDREEDTDGEPPTRPIR